MLHAYNIVFIITLINKFLIRNLINNRTRIHLNLFFAILLQSIIRLIFFIDELVYKLNLKQDSTEAAYESQMMKYHVCFQDIFISEILRFTIGLFS